MRGSILRLMRRYGWRYRWSFLGGIVFVALTNYLAVSIPGEIGRAVDALRASSSVAPHVLAIAVMGLSIIGVRTLSRILIFNPGRDLEYNLRGDLFAKLLALQPAFYAKHKRGDIVSRASAIDLLNRSLLSPYLPFHAARGLALLAIDRVPGLRRLVMRAGLEPPSAVPALMRPEPG